MCTIYRLILAVNRCCFLLLVFFALFGQPSDVSAKAAYASEKEMVARSEIIAIVDVTQVEKAEVQGEHWTYSEKATAQAEQVLKGQLPKEIALYGGEDFICAQVRYQAGRALVFLSRSGELLTGCNWHLSVRTIKDEQIEWFQPETHMQLSKQSTTAILERVERMIRQGP